MTSSFLWWIIAQTSHFYIQNYIYTQCWVSQLQFGLHSWLETVSFVDKPGKEFRYSFLKAPPAWITRHGLATNIRQIFEIFSFKSLSIYVDTADSLNLLWNGMLAAFFCTRYRPSARTTRSYVRRWLVQQPANYFEWRSIPPWPPTPAPAGYVKKEIGSVLWPSFVFGGIQGVGGLDWTTNPWKLQFGLVWNCCFFFFLAPLIITIGWNP